ncbi:MAG: SDR family NAD(P)-dependent oxidoreductase [Hyphomonadaceae bacterium]|nr:SDR family NAD(P)-dependent oxidoreductase [Hyphomonadaceae bacterium]
MPNAFVTGAVMGQGLLLAQKLGKRGWRTFAGALPGQDLSALKGSENVIVIEQDVSSTESVRESAKQVAKQVGDEGLHLLINNAGIANIAQGFVEGMVLDEVERMFQVNTFGQLRNAHFMLPLLRKADNPKARIINFASGAIWVHPVGSGAYNMSKHAVHGLTMQLRSELAPFGIQATTVLPGGVKTNMTANAHQTVNAVFDRMPPEVSAVYKPIFGETVLVKLPNMLEAMGNEPDYTTDKVLELLEIETWATQYPVGKDIEPAGAMKDQMSETAFEGMLRQFGM